MKCGRCGSKTKVYRTDEVGLKVVRYRKCLNQKDVPCGRSFRTEEIEQEVSSGTPKTV